MKSCVSSATLPSAAGPTAAALDVYTTRSTPARRLSSITTFVPPTFTVEQALGVGRPHGRHARAVEHALDSLQRAPHRAPVAHLEPDPRAVELSDRVARREPSSTPSRTSSPRSTSQPGDVRPDEARGSGDECRGALRSRVCWRCIALEAALAVQAAHRLGHALRGARAGSAAGTPGRCRRCRRRARAAPPRCGAPPRRRRSSVVSSSSSSWSSVPRSAGWLSTCANSESRAALGERVHGRARAAQLLGARVEERLDRLVAPIEAHRSPRGRV